MLEAPKPNGLLRTELLRGQDGKCLIQTLWQDRGAIAGARYPCERVGATHSHEVLAVEEQYAAALPPAVVDEARALRCGRDDAAFAAVVGRLTGG